MKIGITGAKGFVGAHLTEKLQKSDHDITAITCNVCDKKDLLNQLSRGGFNIVFHLASKVPSNKTIDEQARFSMYNTNIIGTENVLNCALKLNIRCVYISSLSVCSGVNRHHHVTEEEVAPGDYYSQTKLIGEVLSEHYRKYFDLSTISIRLASVYGPGDRHNFVIPQFLHRVLSGKDIHIYGKGQRKMDFIYIDDAVDAIIKAGMSDKTGVFNIGSGKGTRISKLGELFVEAARVYGFNKKLIYVDSENIADDETCLVGDITKAKTILKFTPRVPLDEGIKKCMEAAREDIKGISRLD